MRLNYTYSCIANRNVFCNKISIKADTFLNTRLHSTFRRTTCLTNYASRAIVLGWTTCFMLTYSENCMQLSHEMMWCKTCSRLGNWNRYIPFYVVMKEMSPTIFGMIGYCRWFCRKYGVSYTSLLLYKLLKSRVPYTCMPYDYRIYFIEILTTQVLCCQNIV